MAGLSIFHTFTVDTRHIGGKQPTFPESHAANHATEALFISWAKGKRSVLAALLGFWDCFMEMRLVLHPIFHGTKLIGRKV